MLSSPEEAILSFKGNLCTKDNLARDGLIPPQLDLNAVAARSERHRNARCSKASDQMANLCLKSLAAGTVGVNSIER